MASPPVLIHTQTRPTIHTYHQHPTHNRADSYSYLDQGRLTPVADSLSPKQAVSHSHWQPQNKERINHMTSRRGHRHYNSTSGSELALEKSISPSLSVGTFYTAVEVVELDSPLVDTPVSIRSNGRQDTTLEQRRESEDMETARLLKELELGDPNPDRKLKQGRHSRRKSSKASSTEMGSRGSKNTSREGSRAASRRTSLSKPDADTIVSKKSRRSLAKDQERPSIPQRRSSRNMSPTRRATLVSFHQNSKSLFQSIGAALEDPKDTASTKSASQNQKRSTLRERSYSSPSTSPYIGQGTGESPLLPQHPSRSTEDILTEEDEELYQPVPATVIHWTSPSTRRQEYQKIDRSHSGVRGMWKKLAPEWCRGKCKRTPFYVGCEKNSDAGSVRRYRIEDDDEETVALQEEKERSKWNCLGLIGQK